LSFRPNGERNLVVCGVDKNLVKDLEETRDVGGVSRIVSDTLGVLLKH
jgi:hypothetical protein